MKKGLLAHFSKNGFWMLFLSDGRLLQLGGVSFVDLGCWLVKIFLYICSFVLVGAWGPSKKLQKESFPVIFLCSEHHHEACCSFIEVITSG